MKRYYDILHGNPKPIRDDLFHQEFGQEPINVYDLGGQDTSYDGKADIICIGETSFAQQPKCFNRREGEGITERKDLFDLADQLLEQARAEFKDVL